MISGDNPLSSPARRRATYEDLLKVPDILIAEVLDGELITSPHPPLPHLRVASVLICDVSPFDRQASNPGGWWILFEPELHLGDDILVPDLAGWQRECMPVLRGAPYFEQAPDWVCEVVSPSTGRIDRVRKMPIYAREQVSHVWLVDPLQRILEVYRLEGWHWVVAGTDGDDEIVRAEPFDAIELEMSRWWLEPEESPDR